MRPTATLAIALFLASTGAFAQDEVQMASSFSLSPAQLLEAVRHLPREAQHAGSGLYREVRYVILEDGRITRTERLIYRVDRLEPSARLDAIQAGFRSWYQNRAVVRARVVSSTGQQHALDPSTLTEVSPPALDPSVVTDAKVLTGPLPGVAPGAVIEIEQTISDREPLFTAGIAQRDWLLSMIPFAHVRVSIEAPEALPLKVALSGASEATRIDRIEQGTRRVQIDVDEAPAIKPRAFLSLLTGGALRIPNVAFGVAESWNDVARGYAALLPKVLDAPAGDWPAAGANAVETLDKLLTAVHARVRYAGVELGSASIIPRSPTETLARGYGDCKDKSLLLLALLRERGVDARLALVSAGAQPEAPENVPGFGLFNHVIVYIPGASPLWIDPTNPYARAGQLPGTVQGRLALVVDPSTEGLTRTYASTTYENTSDLDVEESILPDGGWRVSRTEGGTGRFEMALREVRAGKTPAEFLEEERKKRTGADPDASPGPSTVELEYPNSGDLTTPFVTRTVTEYPGLALDVAPTRLMTKTQPSSLFTGIPLQLLYEPSDEMDDPVEISQPYRAAHRYRFRPPPGFRAANLPEPRNVALGPASLTETYHEEPDGTVLAELRLDVGKRLYSGEEASAFREAVAEERKRRAVTLTFQSVVHGCIAAGRYSEALREARMLADENPESSHLRYGLITALLSVGAGVSARAEADRAVESMSEDPVAWAAAGKAYSHDLIGRLFAPGFDRKRAIEAYRKSLELDRERVRALESLAAVLERDDDGVLYSSDASLQEAYELLSSVKPPRRSKGYGERMAALLSSQGKYVEALTVEGTSDAMAVALQVAAKGFDAAERKIAGLNASNRAMTLSQAAAWLGHWRRYPEAAALKERAAASGDRMASTYASHAAMYRNKHRHEDIMAPAKEPIGVAQRWIRAQFLAEDWKSAVEPLVTKRCGKAELRLQGAERALRSRFEQLTPTVDDDGRLDAYMFRYEWRVEGGDRTGYHVSAHSKTSSYPLNYFIVREDDELRLLDFTDAGGIYMSDLGCYVTSMLDEGRKDEAFAMLDFTARIPRVAFDRSKEFWCERCERTEENARLAAAIFVERDGERAAPLLDFVRRAMEAEQDAERRVALHRTLIRMYEASGRREEAVPLAFAMFEEHPNDTWAVDLAAGVLDRAGHAAEAAERYEAIARQRPEDLTLLREVVAAYTGAGDRAGTVRALEMLGDAATANDWNTRAWVGAVVGEASESDLEAARRAVEEGKRSKSMVNTLAALEALAGNVDGARQLLVESTQPHLYVVATAGDWYVAGLIAEGLGLKVDALAHIGRASALDPSENSSAVGTLARARLATTTSGGGGDSP
jgi:tetratricopeptide (TPR) repeat protein